MLRNLVVTLTLVAATFTARTASADPLKCEKGDKAFGPNCVHVVASKDPLWPNPTNTVYRIEEGTKLVVWEGGGRITESDSAHITVVSQWVSRYGAPTCEVSGIFLWNGKEYAASEEE